LTEYIPRGLGERYPIIARRGAVRQK
jgi:hypothetical protein